MAPLVCRARLALLSLTIDEAANGAAVPSLLAGRAESQRGSRPPPRTGLLAKRAESNNKKNRVETGVPTRFSIAAAHLPIRSRPPLRLHSVTPIGYLAHLVAPDNPERAPRL